MKNIKTIGVFFGGKSPEHDISIITGQLIIAELKKMPEYQVVPVYLDKQERFFIGDELGRLSFFSADNYAAKLSGYGGYSLDLDASGRALCFTKKGMMAKKEIMIDLVFPAFHGNLGEDGSMQGLWNIFGVPYVGCDVAASSLAMDKVLTKIFYQGLSIPTTKFLAFNRAQWSARKEAILEEITVSLRWPVFVKPPHLGSSIGITKVKKPEDLAQACEVALHYDEKVLIEEGVENLVDLTCAVRGYQDPQASLIQESSFDIDLFSYEDKYLSDGGAQLGQAKQKITIPADLAPEISAAIQAASKKIFISLGCVGIARFDFLYNRVTKEFFANEINPLPGTLYHHLWQKSGVEIGPLIRGLIADALLRQADGDPRDLESADPEAFVDLRGLVDQDLGGGG